MAAEPKYPKSDASLSKGGKKDQGAYSDMGGASVGPKKKGAPLDSKASESKQKDAACYSGLKMAKEAGAE